MRVLRPKLFLTYNNLATIDGVGAQLQRIISVFCISKLARVGYLHSPLSDIDTQIYSQTNDIDRMQQVAEWNSLFRPDLEVFSPSGNEYILEFSSVSLLHIRILQFFSKFTVRRIILKVSNPRNITDDNPECLLLAPQLMDEKLWSESNRKREVVVGVHIRQGVLALAQYKNRLLPLKHYEKILHEVVSGLHTLSVKYKIFVFSESNQLAEISLLNPEVKKSIELQPNNPNIEINSNGEVKLIHESPDIVNTPILFKAQWMQDEATLTDFISMVRCDILVISKSSLSFVAGLLSRQSIIIYTPFWHEPPSGWLACTHLTSEIFSKALKDKNLDAIR